MEDLRSEYQHKYYIYRKNDIKKQQSNYRKTDEGKLALKRAKERQVLKKMRELCDGEPFCEECNCDEFEILTVSEYVVLCYNCKYRRNKVLEEDEICQ